MAPVFWDKEGVLLADFMIKGTTVNSKQCTDSKIEVLMVMKISMLLF
jgi:hypothetical protein